ncbi:MAG: hypothetical protein FJ147_26890 [Deltaproteobacteria bacterium]|nr:hypothetical protein [Deltaproteobacteria bacterium]
MDKNRRFSILPFPQFFDGNTLTLNIVVLPRNQNPLKPAIEQHATIPNAPAFAEAGFAFEAKIVSGLSGFPHRLAATSNQPLVRHGQELSYRLRARKKRIVPIAMKLTGFDIERLKLIVGDL